MDDKRGSSSSIASSTRTQLSKSQLESTPEPKKSTNHTSWIIIVLLVIAILTSIFFFVQYKRSQDQLKHPNAAAQSQTQALIDKVGELTDLPSGEPTVATVSDVSKLSSQTFFVNAKNGDKVLIYSSAKKAILYRPSTNKIINIAPLSISNQQP